MPLAVSPDILMPPPSINRSAYRVALSSSVSTEAGESVGTADVTSSEVAATTIVCEIAEIVEIDWNNPTEQRNFASLERKVGRQSASKEEVQKYNRLRTSRRAWVNAQTYLSDYIEEEREKAVLKKLAELQELLRPA